MKKVPALKIKPADEARTGIALRLREIFGSKRGALLSASKILDVDQKTLSTYVRAKALPRPEVLIRIAEAYNVSLDWILRGQETLTAKNPHEAEILVSSRRAEALGLAEELQNYAHWLVRREEPGSGSPAEAPVLNHLTKSLRLDSIGKRFRYLRETEVSPDIKKAAKALKTSPSTIEAVEADRSLPSAGLLGALHSQKPDTINLDWVLTGKA